MVPDGTTYRIDIHQLALAGEDYSNRKTKVFGSKYGLSSFQNWTNRAKGDKVDGDGRPRKNPVRIIADKEYDSDPLGERLLKRAIELICP